VTRLAPDLAERASSSADQEPMSLQPASSGTTATRPSAAAASAMPASIWMAGSSSTIARTSLIQPGVRWRAAMRSSAAASAGWKRSMAWRKAYTRQTKMPAFHR
jgi:hypothetical protein